MNRKSFDFDLITITLYCTLVLLGWMTIYAVSSATSNPVIWDTATLHGKQLVWIGISIFAGMIVLALDYRFIEAMSYFVYAFSIVLLILVLFIGKTINGAQSWLVIAGQPFQPSELAKLATAMALARYMSGLNFSMNNTRQLLGALAIVLLPAYIVILQNDTGSALVFGGLLLVFFREGLNPIIPITLFLVGAVAILTLGLENNLIVVGLILGGAAISFVILYNKRQLSRLLIAHILIAGLLVALAYSSEYIVTKLPAHQQTRIAVLFDPHKDPLNAGYNVIQSQIAIGSGGLTGKGYLNGSYTKYRFVPKQETDFIFCTVGEEGGWLGSAFVIIIFFLLILRLRFLSENSKTNYARVYGYSVLSIIFFHVLVNVGMTIGLVPVIGIPLPFISYGGSSLLNFTLLIAIIVNLYSYRVSVLGSKA